MSWQFVLGNLGRVQCAWVLPAALKLLSGQLVVHCFHLAKCTNILVHSIVTGGFPWITIEGKVDARLANDARDSFISMRMCGVIGNLILGRDPFGILVLLIPACTCFRMCRDDCSLGSGRLREICILHKPDG